MDEIYIKRAAALIHAISEWQRESDRREKFNHELTVNNQSNNMQYNISYDISNPMGFNDKDHLENFIKYLMRTDDRQKWTNRLTKGNIYCIHDDDRLHYYCNVATAGSRDKLARKVAERVKDIPVCSLFSDIAYIYPAVAAEDCWEVFTDLVENGLPGIWKESCPFIGMEDDFLSSSVALVLHTDQSYDGKSIQFHIHHLYAVPLPK